MCLHPRGLFVGTDPDSLRFACVREIVERKVHKMPAHLAIEQAEPIERGALPPVLRTHRERGCFTVQLHGDLARPRQVADRPLMHAPVRTHDRTGLLYRTASAPRRVGGTKIVSDAARSFEQ